MSQNKHKHECIHESRWDNFYNWRENVNNFISEKTTTNGHLKLEDEKLERRLSGIESKIWALILAMLGFILTMLGYMIFK